jgi:peptide/nickel transport system ATP-binding protein
MEALLRIDNLVVHFETDRGTVEAVHKASVAIEKGEVVALVGESGCGKTTLARAILKVIPSPPGRIVSGKVVFKGCDISAMSERECNTLIRGKSITLIPQDPFSSFNPLFTIGTQIWDIACSKLGSGLEQFGAKALSKKEIKEKVVEMLTRVQLPTPKSLLQKYPHELSGGQRQRIMIAMALLPNPELVIADEPTTSLDVTVQAQIVSLLRRLVTERDVSVLYITHDLAVASKISDRIVVMYAGQEVELAPTDIFFSEPAHPYTRMLLECLPNIKGVIQDIPGTVPTLINRPKGCLFHPRCDKVIERCLHELPPSVEISSGHWIRCHNK